MSILMVVVNIPLCLHCAMQAIVLSLILAAQIQNAYGMRRDSTKPVFIHPLFPCGVAGTLS